MSATSRRLVAALAVVLLASVILPPAVGGTTGSAPSAATSDLDSDVDAAASTPGLDSTRCDAGLTKADGLADADVLRDATSNATIVGATVGFDDEAPATVGATAAVTAIDDQVDALTAGDARRRQARPGWACMPS